MKYTFQFLSLTIALLAFQSVAFGAKPWIIDPHTAKGIGWGYPRHWIAGGKCKNTEEGSEEVVVATE